MRVFIVVALVVAIFGIFFNSASRSEEISQTDDIKEASLKEGIDVEKDKEIDDTFESKDAVSENDENDDEEEENDDKIESNPLAESDNTVENIKATSDEEDTSGLFKRAPFWGRRSGRRRRRRRRRRRIRIRRRRRRYFWKG